MRDITKLSGYPRSNVKTRLEQSNNYDNESPDKLLESKADDLDRLLNIEEKMLISNRPEKIKLLTLVPLSWKQKEILDFFLVTKYTITESKNLLQEKGILASPEN